MAEPFRGAFRRPFREQVAAVRLRLGNLVPTARWDDISRDQHNLAFMVAGATKADLLADLAAAVEKAIAEGTGFEAFKRDFRSIVEKHGWYGWTGDESEKRRNWRMRTIYRTNMRTSYMAGRHAQLVEGGFKYWVYRHGGSLEPRLHHLAWDGLILPSDHPFWATHFPPNGWGCSCRVFGARSIEGAKRRGGDPSVELEDGWDRLDPKTGAPPGIDRLWDYAPGASVADEVRALRGKLDRLPFRPSVALIQDWLRDSLFEAWTIKPEGSFPVARIKNELADLISARTRVVEITAGVLRKQLREHPEISAFEYRFIQDVVDHAQEIVQDSSTSLIFIRQADDGLSHTLVVRAELDGDRIVAVSFRRLSDNPAKRASEIARLRRRR